MKKILSIVLTALFILSFGTLCFADELPYWYPEDVEAFEDYHAESAPRVVDDAKHLGVLIGSSPTTLPVCPFTA